MSTPAPSLEDMPPEKGTILQLHSIDAKWDGKLVEFLGPVKDNGKYLVQSFDGEEEDMTVKPKVCKQPGIQPLAMRVVLYNISRTLSSKRRNLTLPLWSNRRRPSKNKYFQKIHAVLLHITVLLAYSRPWIS
jgi:hypothetical protein